MSELWTWIKSRFTPRLVLQAHRVQQDGMSGEDIAEFQRVFNLRARRFGLRIPVTGVYDRETRDAVSAFQRFALSIGTADGFVGPQTARRLHIKLVGED